MLKNQSDYQKVYEDCFNHTSSEWAPWFIIPADNKWFTRLAVSEIVVHTLKRLNLRYPEVSEQRRQELQEIRKLIESESAKKKEGSITIFARQVIPQEA